MVTILKNYGRWQLLRSQLPILEQEKEHTRRLALAADRERSQKKVEWKCLENPGFFQRLLGKMEERRETAYRAYQAAEAAWNQAGLASEQAAQACEAAKAELDTLAGAEEAYAQLDKTRQVREMAMDALLPAARYNLNQVLPALEQALEWESSERNVGGRMPNQDDGMWEQLNKAREPARKLKEILAQFPEPDSWICDYLRNPDGFIYDGVIMKVSPRNKIRTAIGQMEKLKSKLQ